MCDNPYTRNLAGSGYEPRTVPMCGMCTTELTPAQLKQGRCLCDACIPIPVHVTGRPMIAPTIKASLIRRAALAEMKRRRKPAHV